MSPMTIPVVSRSVETTNRWLDELATELGADGDRHYAYRVLRATLHALRDRLPIDEAAQLAAQLPELVRGIYYEGWDPSRTPVRQRHADAFVDRIRDEAGIGATEASFAVAAAMRVLGRHVSGGEIDDVRGALPAQVRRLLDGDGPVRAAGT